MLKLINELFDVIGDGSYACIEYEAEGFGIRGVRVQRVRNMEDMKQYNVPLPPGTTYEEAIVAATTLYDLYIINQGVKS